jgi:DNA primase catalytic core
MVSQEYHKRVLTRFLAEVVQMARISDEELERLKRETDLAELVRAKGVELRKHGSSDLIGHCIFHEDRSPSLVVTPEKNLFHCLGCGAAGSVIDWVMRTEGVSFLHAVELLREDSPSLAASERPLKRTTVRRLPCPLEVDAADAELLGQVVGYYHETLKDDAAGLAFLERRGLAHSEMIDRFSLGLANRTLGLRLPDRRRKAGAGLRGRLQKLGILRTSGHEHLNGCLTIPVLDEAGRVAEVYGRRLDDHLPQGTPAHLYLPGPHRGVFNLPAFRDSKEIILCEALIDALTFWVAGFHHVTSSFGTNGFTLEMLEAMKAYGTERALIAYDRDDAGDRAAAKLAERLASEGIASYRVLFPRGMDANAYALKVTPANQSLAVLLRSAEHMAGPLPQNPPATQPPEKAAKERKITEETSSPPLAAGVSPADEVMTEEIAASPVPPVPKLEVPAEVTDNEVVISLGDRRFRVRGLAKNMSYEQLRVNVLVSRSGADAFHVDTFDLYSARQRTLFVKQAATELGLKPEEVKADLGRVLIKLEELQDSQIRGALEPEREEVVLSEGERSEALELLEDPRLLERIVTDLERCGVVGEETNKLVGYLAAVSRKLSEPLAVLVQSSSAAGKSALMNAVLSLAPSDERVHYSAMTGQSLFYMGEADLKHKILAIAEEEGAERASYALKLLQSEGELTIASTGKDPSSGRLVTHSYRVEGPVMIFLTTTAVDIDEELLNRCLVLTVDEDREQTRAIHRSQRERRTLEGLRASRERQRIQRLHRNAQRLLSPLAVVNPYARRLTFLDTLTRTRRDHEKYLTLIEAVALLHQRQRPRRRLEHGGEVVEYVEATLDDIAIANRLAAEVLGRTLDELPPQSRRFLELLSKMVDERCEADGVERSGYRFTRREVLDHTAWSYPQVRRHLERLVELEYVLVHRGHRGQSLVYELLWQGQGRRGEPFLIGLLDAEKLERINNVAAALTPSAEALTPDEASFDPPLTPGCPPDDPRLTPKEIAAKASNASVCEQSMGESPENAHLDPDKNPASYRSRRDRSLAAAAVDRR